MGAARTFRFRPRHRLFPYAASGIGALFVVAALVGEYTPRGLLWLGLVGLASGLLYQLSPAWKLSVVVDDAGVRVMRGDHVRVDIPWSEAHLTYAPDTKVCYIDAGDAARRLVVTGPGMQGPYRIEHREELYDLLVARVPAERRRPVEPLAPPAAVP